MNKHTLIFQPSDFHNFEAIRNGSKTIETRAGSPTYNTIKAGDEIIFTCKEQSLNKVVKEVRHYATLEDLYKDIPMQTVMPHKPQVSSFEQAQAIWLSYPGYKQRIEQYGMLAIFI